MSATDANAQVVTRCSLRLSAVVLDHTTSALVPNPEAQGETCKNLLTFLLTQQSRAHNRRCELGGTRCFQGAEKRQCLAVAKAAMIQLVMRESHTIMAPQAPATSSDSRARAQALCLCVSRDINTLSHETLFLHPCSRVVCTSSLVMSIFVVTSPHDVAFPSIKV